MTANLKKLETDHSLVTTALKYVSEFTFTSAAGLKQTVISDPVLNIKEFEL